MAMATNASKNNLSTYSGECKATDFIAPIAWTVFATGVISNSLLLYFVVKRLTAGKRNDKLFLLNIIIANFFSLFGSLLGEALGRGKIFPNAKDYCLLLHQVNFVSLCANLTSMAALCYDRYENLAKLPSQRSLTFRKSMKLVVFSWALPVLLVPIAESGFFIAAYGGHNICQTYGNRTPALSEISSFFALIALISIWISIHSRVIKQSLWEIYSKLKQHRRETEAVLGMARTVREVNLKKQALAMVVCYSVCWIPFGLAAGLIAADVTSFYSCFYFGCLVGAHASSATTPLIYLTVDRRFRLKFGKSRKPKYRLRPPSKTAAQNVE